MRKIVAYYFLLAMLFPALTPSGWSAQPLPCAGRADPNEKAPISRSLAPVPQGNPHLFRVQLIQAGFTDVEFVSSGGMGYLYSAKKGSSRVAVKVVYHAQARSLNELQAIAQNEVSTGKDLMSEGACFPQVYETGNLNGVPYFTMSWLEGETLSKWVGRATAYRQ